MRSISIQKFTGESTVKSNKSLKTNAIFISKVNDFDSQLSSSHYAVKFPLKGIENYKIQNKEYSINNKNYLLANPGEEIYGFVKSNTPVIGVCIGFTNEFILKLSASIEQKLEGILDDPFYKKTSIEFISKKNRILSDQFSLTLQKVKHDILKNQLDKYNTDQFYISIAEALLKKEAQVFSNIESLPHIKASSKEEIYRRVCIMEDFIHSNYKNDITLDEIALVSSLSKYHALRCYNAIKKITPYQQILKLRLEESKRLIETGMSISDVAYEVNFSDYRSFSKKFKLYFGMTPSQFKLK